MSIVTGILIVVSVSEGDGDRTPEASIDRLNDWIETNTGIRPLLMVEEGFGGNKHPQLIAAGAGMNWFDEDAFAEAFLALPWTDPENVVLIMQPEHGPTKVIRPSESSPPAALSPDDFEDEERTHPIPPGKIITWGQDKITMSIDREIPITAGDLIEQLKRFPADTPVFADGEFTMAITLAEPARVEHEDQSLSGYDTKDGEPNAVLLR